MMKLSKQVYIALATVFLIAVVSVALLVSRKSSLFGDKEAVIDLGGGQKMRLALIPAGQFIMGSSPQEQKTAQDEAVRARATDYDPTNETQHTVAISKPFYMGIYSVTQAQWKAVMDTQPWKGKEYVLESDDCPATYVSWNTANEFCRRLSGRIARVVRLPTEAEREYACRAGSQTRFGFGDDPDYLKLDEYAWYDGSANIGREQYAHPVGRKKPNDWGLYDMNGNVWEWCSDRFEKDYYAQGDMTDPAGSTWAPCHSVRGGCWARGPRFCRSAYRGWNDPLHQRSVVGFRVVIEVK
jgi:formylglycine-generating enzyme required for sulfatase activity